MGTRGAYGFYKNGQNKITYNHYDSYPQCLGEKMVDFISARPTSDLNEIFNKIELVDEDKDPTTEQINNCLQFFNSSKSGSWYNVLNEYQGDLSIYDTSDLKYMFGGYETFISDSLMCEFAYVINLDEECLELYKGFNTDKDKENVRYRAVTPVELGKTIYYGCSLVRKYPLSVVQQFPLKTVKDMIKRTEEDEL